MTHNDDAERLARDCETAAWCLKGAGEFETGQATLTKAAALIRAQAARIADHAETLLKMEELAIARQARAEAAEAEVARLRDKIGKPMTYAEVDEILATVKIEEVEQCRWLQEPLFLSRALSTILAKRAALQRKSGE